MYNIIVISVMYIYLLCWIILLCVSCIFQLCFATPTLYSHVHASPACMRDSMQSATIWRSVSEMYCCQWCAECSVIPQKLNAFKMYNLTFTGFCTSFSSITCTALPHSLPLALTQSQVIRVMMKDSLWSIAQYQSLNGLTARYLYNKNQISSDSVPAKLRNSICDDLSTTMQRTSQYSDGWLQDALKRGVGCCVCVCCFFFFSLSLLSPSPSLFFSLSLINQISWILVCTAR